LKAKKEHKHAPEKPAAHNLAKLFDNNRIQAIVDSFNYARKINH
jgi:hypothetical protein